MRLRVRRPHRGRTWLVQMRSERHAHGPGRSGAPARWTRCSPSLLGLARHSHATARNKTSLFQGGSMRRAVRWATLSVGLAGLVTMLTVTPSEATPPSGLTNIPLARGTDTSHGTIPLRFGTDIAMAKITVDPGGFSGWHSHPGGAIIIVQQGTLTVYRA